MTNPDTAMITTIASALGILVGVYAIVNRTEDRIGRRIEDTKDLLKSAVAADVATLRKEMKEMEIRLNDRIDSRIVRR